jgi:putative oxidoreductase
MSLTRVVARPLLSSIFIYGGLDAYRHPQTKVKAAEPVVRWLTEKASGRATDTEAVVKLNGAIMVTAGTLLAIGKLRRLAALALLASLLPTTYAGHRFWEEGDDIVKSQQRVHFLKNVGLVGGLILAAVDTEGRPSLAWRAKGAARHAAKLASGGPLAVLPGVPAVK